MRKDDSFSFPFCSQCGKRKELLKMGRGMRSESAERPNSLAGCKVGWFFCGQRSRCECLERDLLSVGKSCAKGTNAQCAISRRNARSSSALSQNGTEQNPRKFFGTICKQNTPADQWTTHRKNKWWSLDIVDWKRKTRKNTRQSDGKTHTCLSLFCRIL